MLSILKSERFQKEYQEYQDKIEKITDDTVRAQANGLLKSLVNEIQKLDNQHQDMFSAKNNSSSDISDIRNSITELRKNLQSLLK
jgi:phage shock protein A